MLILDVDGTMTDNGIYIDENGIESKRYNAKDGVGIYELIKKRNKNWNYKSFRERRRNKIKSLLFRYQSLLCW